MNIMLARGGHSYMLVKQGNKYNHVIPLDAGGLSVVKLTDEAMHELEMKELKGYPIQKALEIFRRSVINFGATEEAKRYLLGDKND
jgi:hypothetical protein